MTVPHNIAGSSRAITRSRAMIDAYSVPSAPDTSASTRPGRTPCAPTTGMLSPAINIVRQSRKNSRIVSMTRIAPRIRCFFTSCKLALMNRD